MSSVKPCNGCHRATRWSEQKRGWGVLVSHGVPKQAATAAMPLCLKCARRRLKEEDLVAYWEHETRNPNSSKHIPHAEYMELLRQRGEAPPE